MLTVLDILEDAYTEGGATTEYKASNILGLKHLHLTVQDFWSHAVKLKKANSNWDIWYTNTVALQDEYKKPSVSSDDVGAQYIESVSVAYSADAYSTGNLKFIPCRDAMDYEIKNWEYYLENQPNTEPMYFERDNSVFIAPDPRTSEIGTNRIKITGIRSVASGTWTTSTNETAMKLPLVSFDVLKLGLIARILAWHRRDTNEIISAENRYEIKRNDVIATMFTETPFINEFPNV